MRSSASTSGESMPTWPRASTAERRSVSMVGIWVFAWSWQARLVSTSSTRFVWADWSRLARPALPLQIASGLGAVADVGQACFLIELDARLDDRRESTVHHRVEIVGLVPGAVVCDPVLGEVVGADALGAVHGADLALARGTVEFGLVFLLLGED